jgi:uncharacterized protein (TIGR02588 family)
MAGRSTRRPSLAERTPVAEWIAAGLGLLLTATVVGHALWEGLAVPDTPPELEVRAAAPAAVPGGWRVDVTVRNRGHRTAAAVEVAGAVVGGRREQARMVIDYVPAQGEATGALMFRSDPRGGLEVKVEGWVDP